jgi:hypothetical protein
VLKTLLNVLNVDKPHKDGTMKSESEITMCDRMEMYIIYHQLMMPYKNFHTSGLSFLHDQTFSAETSSVLNSVFKG